MSILGFDAMRAVQELVRSMPAISTVRVFKYQPPPAAQLRIERTEVENLLFEKALALRKAHQLPFWDSLLLSCFSCNEVPQSILDAAQLHISHRSSETEVERSNILDGTLRKLAADRERDSSLALISEVRTINGTSEHIPLLDFHIPHSEVNQNIVTAILNSLLPSGFILLRSGRSYHAWGTKTIELSDYATFLARAMLYSPIIDRAYLAHPLIENRSAWRISE
jgi:hypothetical protein